MPLIEEIATHLIRITTTEDENPDHLFLVADGVSRASLFQILQGRYSKSKLFANFAYELLEIIAAREPNIRFLPVYELVIRERCCVYPELNIVQAAFEWAAPLDRPRLVARIVTTLIFRLTFAGLELGPAAAPNTPNPPLTETSLQLILPLCDQLEIAIFKGNYHQSPDEQLITSTASTANVVESTLRALRSYFKWDIEGAVRAVEETALQAPLVWDIRPDSTLVLDIASYVAVQLFGLLFSKEYITPLSKYTDRDVFRLANWTELLLKYARMSPWPWGKFWNDWNEGIFSNFLRTWHQSRPASVTTTTEPTKK
jgi:hypothetical protein